MAGGEIMRIPEFLKDGGTIGFAAPSFGCNIEPYKSAFNSAQEKFRSLGSFKSDPGCRVSGSTELLS